MTDSITLNIPKKDISAVARMLAREEENLPLLEQLIRTGGVTHWDLLFEEMGRGQSLNTAEKLAVLGGIKWEGQAIERFLSGAIKAGRFDLVDDNIIDERHLDRVITELINLNRHKSKEIDSNCDLLLKLHQQRDMS